jgi:hypothetical protein
MCEINKGFDDLYTIYQKQFDHTECANENRKDLLKIVPPVRGVYLIWKTTEKKPLYIGSSGKIKKGMLLSGQNVKARIFGSSTPYKIDRVTNEFKYVPKTTGVPPSGYYHAVKLTAIRITIIATPTDIAPSVLEHLLIQGFINQFHDLPEANQKI